MEYNSVIQYIVSVMMVCLILTHNVIRIYHKSCWRQLSYCGLHVRAVSVFGKKSDAVCGFLAYFCAVLRFSDPPFAPPPPPSIIVKFLLKITSLRIQSDCFDSAQQIVPWVPESFFLACDEELRRAQADTSSAEGRRHERRSREKNLGSRAPWFIVLYGPWPCL